MLLDSVVATVVCTRPRAIPLVMITMRNQLMGSFSFPNEYGATLDGSSGRRSSAVIIMMITI